MKQVLLLAILLLCVSSSLGAQKVFMGYYPVWAPSQTSKSGCGLNIVDIPANKYTHLIAFWFFQFSSTDGSVSLYKDQSSDAAVLLPQLMALKNTNPSLKILMCLGGAGISTTDWKGVMGSTTRRATFISSALSFVRQYRMDGIDIDWEGLDSETAPLVQLLFRDLRAAAPAGTLITAATFATQYWLNFFHPENVVSYVDYFNVMLYDFTGYTWSDTTYANTPLNGINGLSINQSIAGYINNGIPTSKIVFGFANYGRSFTMPNPGINQPNPKVAGTPGHCDNQGGWLTYKEVETLIANPPTSDFKITYDLPTQTPYLTYGNQFVSYDNQRSIAAKLDFLFSSNLAGGMIYSTDNSHTIADQVWASLSSGGAATSSTSSSSSRTSPSSSSSSSPSSSTTSRTSSTTSPSSSTTAKSSTTQVTATPTSPPLDGFIKNSAPAHHQNSISIFICSFIVLFLGYQLA